MASGQYGGSDVPQITVQGVRIQQTGNKKWKFDYEQGDMKAALQRGDWKNWQDLINWLEKQGEKDNELTPGETVAMVEDLRSVKVNKMQFTRDSKQAYTMAHNFRSQNNKQFGQEHAQYGKGARRK
jgi:hypothetical protein